MRGLFKEQMTSPQISLASENSVYVKVICNTESHITIWKHQEQQTDQQQGGVLSGSPPQQQILKVVPVATDQWKPPLGIYMERNNDHFLSSHHGQVE